MSDPLSLSGKTALVTGGSQGIGLAVAQQLAARGATVAVASRSVQTVGNDFPAYRVDVSDESACRTVIADCEKDLGRLDVLVNAAGIAESYKFLATTTEIWRRHMAVDVEGPMWLTQAALAGMLERGSGRVISVASLAARIGLPYVSAYTAAKHALVGLTRSLAAEFARSGVTFNCVCPFYVDTPMTAATVDNIVARTGMTRESALTHLLSPQGRLIDPAEVAQLCAYLASDAAYSITGQAWNLDGGFHQS